MIAMAAAIITNAVSMQTGSHPSPLFSDPRPVRDDRFPLAVDPATTESIRPSAAIAEQDRAIVAAVQAELRARGFYDGAVDGLSGPVTSAAIMRFEAAAGLPETGEPDDTLLAALRGTSRVAAAPPALQPVADEVVAPQASGAPIPRAKPRAAAEPVDPIAALVAAATPAPSEAPAPPPAPVASAPARVEPVAPPAPAPAPVQVPAAVAESGAAAPIRSVKVQPIRISAFEEGGEPAATAPTVTATADPRLARIQAALGDLGFGPVAADGVMNEATRAAIADFESYRGLPRTGSVNERVLAELVAIGGLSLNQ
ncbi:peptidoglycan-binding domain-containing protein [Methylobrevis albus]|uniref:Peptidoglycan-binding protein n=1 Tax=Methylobrevis albus TaxID=2793297 RepID=A0A931HZV8_9HYPH|nr:peptidoglycan-binding domain-containing protein [Methylobrevis albus]MBH0237162.1 peptidoglycan-binding protein [Methylobrevis albus]